MKQYLAVFMIGALICLPLFAASDSKSEAGSTEKKDKAILLFNGKDLSGWKLFLPDENADPANTWSVSDGVVHCTGQPAGYMRTEKQYGNYTLYLQWRFPKDPGNSGVLLHLSEPDMVWPKSIEAQLHHRDAGDFWVIEGTEFTEHAAGGKRVNGRRTIKLEKSSEKDVGEWNQYRIECKGDSIRVYVNDVLQNVASNSSVQMGHIGLQSEGAPIEFRNINIVPFD